MRRSSHTITYPDLIRWAQNQERYALIRLENARKNGVTNLEALTKDMECAKTAARLFKKCQPGKQADLFAIFQELR